MDFETPVEIRATLDALDRFIEREIKPLEQQDDNIRFFDHRREWARTDFDAGGVPRAEWEDLLREMRRRADAAGWLRHALPKEFGGNDASNLEMAIIREHLAAKGLGLHNDLQNESSIVGNFPTVLMMRDFGSEEQKAEWMPGFLDGTRRLAFGLTEPGHGSDATFLETTAVADGDEWVINGQKRFNSGLHHATHDIIFARTSGDPGSPVGISAFLVPTDAPGFSVDFFWWTFNMPTDHAEVTMTDVRVGVDAVFGRLDHGLELAQHFVHENRIRQAASSLGAAQFCIDEAVAYANGRTTWNKKLSTNQGIQFPLVELHTEAAMLRQLIRLTAWQLDRQDHMAVTHLVAMCNYRANRLACDAADRAMQTCGGVGYSRHMPFEHIYRHHRRYRITEGAEEIQMRKVAQHLFGFREGGVIAEAEVSARARALGAAVEPFTGQVYFSPECHERYEALGFSGSPASLGGVAMPDGAAYFCSRGSVMGQVPGQVVAAAFGVFNPAVVVPAVAYGWTLVDAATICAARTEGAVGQLRRILGDSPDGLDEVTKLLHQANEGLRPEGKPLYAGLVGQGLPGDPMGDAWRLADQLREYRGDVHIAAWTNAGFDATEIGLLTELYWGLPMRTYVRTRAWSNDELDAAEARLVERGLVADGAFTAEGRAAREAIEQATDRSCRRIIEALGDDHARLVEILSGWGVAIRDAGGYPASGPHDLAGLSN